MSLDLSPSRTLEGRGSSSSPASTRAPRVVAVVVARSAASLVAALAGIAAQTRAPDLLVGVDCTPEGTLILPGTPATATDRGVFDELVDVEPEMDVEPLGYADDELDELPTGEYDVLDETSLRDADGVPVVSQEDTTSISVAASTPADALSAHCDHVLRLPVRTGTTEAVAAALRWVDEESGAQTAGVQDWIWLLGDSDRPSMKALEQLVAATRTSANLGVVGVKHRTGATGHALVDAGLTTTRSGRILSFVETDEPDQGQRDHVSDTLAVPLSGMLVRRDLWQRMRGLDPALDRGSRLDAAVELCRRVWLSGNRVEVVPSAVLTSSAGARPADLRARTHRRLAGAALPAVPFVALGVVLGALLRLLGGLVLKEPIVAARRSGASLLPLLRPDQVARSRWRARSTRSVPRRRLTPLLAGRRDSLRWHRERFSRTRPRLVSPAGGERTRDYGRVTALVVLLSAAGAVALSRVLGGGPFSSAHLATVGTDAGGLLRAAGGSWVPGGLGSPGPADPLLGVVAALGLPLASPRSAVLVLLATALPLAGLGAWWAAGGLTRRPGVRALVALAWATSPVLLLGLGAGRLPVVLAAVFLPVAVRCVGQAVAASSRAAVWSWSAVAGMLLVPATVGLPVLPVVLTLFLAVLALRTRRAGLVFAAVPALTLCLPLLLAARSRPEVLVGEPGRTVRHDGVQAWAALLGWDAPAAATVRPVGDLAHRLLDPIVSPALVTTTLTVLPWMLGAVPALLAVAGLGQLFRGTPRGSVARVGWLLAAAGVALAYGCQLVVVGADAAGPVRGAATAGVLLAVAGLLVAGTAAWAPPRAGRRRAVSALRGTALGLGATLAVLLALSGLGLWTAGQLVRPAATDLRPGAQPPLPAVAVDAATSPDAVRTLALSGRSTDQLSAAVLRGAGDDPSAHSVAVTVRRGAAADPGEKALATALGSLMSGAQDARPLLAPFGIGTVVVLPGDDAASRATAAELSARLDSTLGVSPSATVSGVRAWRVDSYASGAQSADRPAAARLLPATPADGPRWQALPVTDDGIWATLQGTSGGTLALAERADPGWRASLDGRRLEPVTVDGWAQGFELPAGCGELRVEHVDEPLHSLGWLQVAVLGLTVLLALPVRSRREVRR